MTGVLPAYAKYSGGSELICFLDMICDKKEIQ